MWGAHRWKANPSFRSKRKTKDGDRQSVVRNLAFPMAARQLRQDDHARRAIPGTSCRTLGASTSRAARCRTAGVLRRFGSPDSAIVVTLPLWREKRRAM